MERIRKDEKIGLAVVGVGTVLVLGIILATQQPGIPPVEVGQVSALTASLTIT